MPTNIPNYLPAEYSLHGHRAIVASSGGEETPQLAAVLAEAGANIFAVARHQDAVDAIRSAVSATTGEETPGYAGRWDDPAGAAGVLASFAGSYIRADILVNDTRSFFAKPAADISMAEWDELHARNVRATFMLSQAVGQQMLAQQYGRIVNVISNLAERAVINCSAYSATQAAVLSLTPLARRGMGTQRNPRQRRWIRLVHGRGHPPRNPARGTPGSLHAHASQGNTPRPGGHVGVPVLAPLRLPQRPTGIHRRWFQRPPVIGVIASRRLRDGFIVFQPARYIPKTSRIRVVKRWCYNTRR